MGRAGDGRPQRENDRLVSVYAADHLSAPAMMRSTLFME